MSKYYISYNYDDCSLRSSLKIGTFNTVKEAARKVEELMIKTLTEDGFISHLDDVDISYYEPDGDCYGCASWNVYWTPFDQDDYGYRVNFTIYRMMEPEDADDIDLTNLYFDKPYKDNEIESGKSIWSENRIKNN